MPRGPRRTSPTEIYHIMVRGNERKAIFAEGTDKERFLAAIREKKKGIPVSIYAYCIMDNHAHLLLRGVLDPLAALMKNVGISFAKYYNAKYDRVGHVFQDRFRSEVIKTEAQLFAVMRYIHFNPVKVWGVTALEYPWSSYSGYIAGRDQAGILDAGDVWAIFGDDLSSSQRQFMFLHERPTEEAFFLEVEEDRESPEEYVLNFLRQHKLTREELSSPAHARHTATLLCALRDYLGMSGRKSAEVTGLSRYTAFKLLGREKSAN